MRRSLSTNLSPNPQRSVPFLLLVSAAFGSALPVAASLSTPLLLMLLAASCLPLLLLTMNHSAQYGIFVIVVAQVLEPFEISLGFISLSVGTLALALWFVIWGHAVLVDILSSPFSTRMTVICSLFAASHGLQLLHASPAAALRGMVTVTSFLLFWLIGVFIGRDRRSHMFVAMGATGALCLLGVIGMLAASGIVQTGVQSGGVVRDFFGFTSPFFRNYAFPGMQPVTVALLLSISIPFLASNISSSTWLQLRISSSIMYIFIFISTLLIFQSRSMLLELAAMWAIVVVAKVRKWWAVLPAASVFSWVLFNTVQDMLSVDTISSDLRSESYSMAIDYIRLHPTTLLIGGPHDEIVNAITASSKYGSLIGYAPIHNMFLDQILWGGLVAALSLTLLFVDPLWRILRRAGTNENTSRILTVSFGIAFVALFEIMVNPVVANVAGLWIGLGIMTGIAASLDDERSHATTTEFEFENGASR